MPGSVLLPAEHDEPGSVTVSRRDDQHLGDDPKQQILALGRLGWPLRRIEQATGVRRETARACLVNAGALLTQLIA